MKFEDFRKTCTVIDTSIPEPTLPVVRHKMLGQGTVKCRTCDYWPTQSYWLDDNGQCTKCRQDNHTPFTSASDSAEIFASTYPEICSGCGGRFFNLKKEGICATCMVTNQEKVNSHTMSRIPSDASRGQGSVAHWCYTCDRYGADRIGGKCVDCARKDSAPSDSFNLKKYLCVRCHEQKAYVLSGTCHECAMKQTRVNRTAAMGETIGELREKLTTKQPPIQSGPMLVKCTPKEEGGWDTVRVPMIPRVMSMNEKLGQDARMGIYEEC